MKEQPERRDGNVRVERREQARGGRRKGVAAARMKRMKRAREDESVRTEENEKQQEEEEEEVEEVEDETEDSGGLLGGCNRRARSELRT